MAFDITSPRRTKAIEGIICPRVPVEATRPDEKLFSYP